jgi:Putative MetA-pathway of phenol degradation
MVGYVLAANGAARADEDLGTGGSAVLFQTGVRLGLGAGWEAQLFADTYLSAMNPGLDGDAADRSRAGLGFLTLRAKAEVWGGSASEAGLALVPFVRIPVNRTLTGQAGAEPGLIAPFSVDLDHGWEIQGSTGVTLGREADGDRVAEWETQAGLEWHFAPHWSLSVEPELEVGDGRPQWAMEQGLTIVLARAWQLDLGVHAGLGRNAGARFGYMGLGFTF